MLERFIPQSHEIPPQQLVETLIIPSFTENPSEENPHLDRSSRTAALAGGLLVNADLAKKIILLGTPEGTRLMKDYLGDIGISDNSLITKETSGEHASDIKKMVSDNKHGEVGLVSAGDLGEKIKEGLNHIKVDLEPISPGEEIGKRIVESARGKGRAVVEVLKAAFVRIVKDHKALDEVKLTRLSLSPAK